MRSLAKVFSLAIVAFGLSCGPVYAQKMEILPNSASLYTVPANPNPGDTTTVCWGVAIPSGWVAVDQIWSANTCGNPITPSANVIKIEYVVGFPAGKMVDVCTGGAAEPSGWIIHDAIHSSATCQFTPADNISVLEKYAGLPIGSEISYCTLIDRVPNGWSVVSQSYAPLNCGEPNYIVNNVTLIKRVQ